MTHTEADNISQEQGRRNWVPGSRVAGAKAWVKTRLKENDRGMETLQGGCEVTGFTHKDSYLSHALLLFYRCRKQQRGE